MPQNMLTDDHMTIPHIAYEDLSDQGLYRLFLCWMKRELDQALCDDASELVDWRTLEVNLTKLVEHAVWYSDYIPESLQLEVLEDETHPINDAAVDAAKWYEEKEGKI